MDGVTAMALKLNLSKKGGVWQHDSMAELSLLSPYDRLVLLVFIVSFIGCVSGMLVMVSFLGVDILNSAMLLTVPFFLQGLMWYKHTRKWATLIFILIVSVALILAKSSSNVTFWTSENRFSRRVVFPVCLAPYNVIQAYSLAVSIIFFSSCL